MIYDFPLPLFVCVCLTAVACVKSHCLYSHPPIFSLSLFCLGDHLGGTDQQQTRDKPIPLQPMPSRKVRHLALQFLPFLYNSTTLTSSFVHLYLEFEEVIMARNV